MQNDSFLKNELKEGGGRGGLGYNYLEGAKFLKKWDFFGNFFCIGQNPSTEILQPFFGKNHQCAGRFREVK